jgi:hypothetical protein
MIGLLSGCAHFGDPQLPAQAYGVVELPWERALAEPPAVPFAVVDVFEVLKRARLESETEDEIVERFAAALEPYQGVLEQHAPGLYGSDLAYCVDALNERYFEIWFMHREVPDQVAWAYADAEARFSNLAFGGTVFVVPGCMDAQGEAGIETDTIAVSLESIDSSGGSVTSTLHHELFHHHHAIQAPALFDGDTTLHEVVWREGMATWAAAEMGPPGPRSWRATSPDLMADVAKVVRDEPESRTARSLDAAVDGADAPRAIYLLGAALVERMAAETPEAELVRLEGEALLTRMLDGLDDGAFVLTRP